MHVDVPRWALRGNRCAMDPEDDSSAGGVAVQRGCGGPWCNRGGCVDAGQVGAMRGRAVSRARGAGPTGVVRGVQGERAGQEVIAGRRPGACSRPVVGDDPAIACLVSASRARTPGWAGTHLGHRLLRAVFRHSRRAGHQHDTGTSTVPHIARATTRRASSRLRLHPGAGAAWGPGLFLVSGSSGRFGDRASAGAMLLHRAQDPWTRPARKSMSATLRTSAVCHGPHDGTSTRRPETGDLR